jgi:hypothetical protein
MQVEMKGTGERQHVSQSVAATLIAAGLATEVSPNAEPKQPNLRFFVIPGPYFDGYQYPPAVGATCSTCGHNSNTSSRKGTAHLADVRHCGIVERCNQQTAAEYLDHFTKWQAKSSKTLPVKVSPYTEKHVAAFGMKTQAELQTDAQLLAMKAGK